MKPLLTVPGTKRLKLECDQLFQMLLDFAFNSNLRRYNQGMKLSATGQELGGNLLFPRRLGFSGTPADLLPLELGAPKFEPGTDAKVLATLTDTTVVSIRDVGVGWDVRSLLRAVAAGAFSRPLFSSI